VRKSRIVGIGGTTSSPSSTERALRIALAAAEAAGADVQLFGGEALARLPLYVPKLSRRTPDEKAFVDAVRCADGLIIASPGYHGSISGLVKNAIDHLEETAGDARPYLDGVPVGLIATAYGWQATGGVIMALRSIVHALRGWPTPFAAAVNSAVTKFEDQGGCAEAGVVAQLEMVGTQVLEFVRAHKLDRARPPAALG
jgi:FMN reductase